MHTEVFEVQARHLFVELLWQAVYLCIQFFCPQFDLREGLVAERIAHHERRMAGRTAEVYEAAFGQHEDRMSVGETVLVHLRFDFGFYNARIGFEACHLDFVVEVADVADDRLVAHPLHVLDPDDVPVAGGRHVDIAFRQCVFDRFHFETFHRGLQRADRVDFGDDHPGSVRPHTHCASFAHVAVAANHDYFSGDHYIRRAFDTVGQRFAAAVQVVEFTFGHRVVHIDRGYEQFAARLHLVKPVYAGGGLFRNPFPFGYGAVPFVRVFFQQRAQRVDNDPLFLAAGGSVEH